MKQKTITIEIDERGNSAIDLAGFEGKGCQKVVDEFRGGDKVTAAKTKREYLIEPAKNTLTQGR